MMMLLEEFKKVMDTTSHHFGKRKQNTDHSFFNIAKRFLTEIIKGKGSFTIIKD